MYQANIEITQGGDPSKFTVEDISASNETVISRVFELTKNDLITVSYPFTNGVATIVISDMDKDYALSGKFIAVTQEDLEDSVYTKEIEFVLLGYAKKGFTKRMIDLEVDESIVDKKAHRDESNQVIYYQQVAEDCVQFSDMVGAQKALDYIAEINNAGINSN